MKPPGSVLHGIEQVAKQNLTNISENMCQQAFVLACPKIFFFFWEPHTSTIIGMVDAAAHNGHVSKEDAEIAKSSYYTLIDPTEVQHIFNQADIRVNFCRLV